MRLGIRASSSPSVHPTRSPPPVLRGVKGIAELGKYKGILMDQFGVLHDGKTPYPGAIDAIRFLAEDAGLKILLLSNSSRRAAGATKKLADMGFSERWFTGVVTSGEITHQKLSGRKGSEDAFWRGLGDRCLHFNWSERGAISLEGLGLQIVSNPEEAEFILAHGTEVLSGPSSPGEGKGGEGAGTRLDLAGFERVLSECMRVQEQSGRTRRIPMIVANPDIVTVAGGGLAMMPGALAAAYRKMGGEVHLMGKPAPIIYEFAAASLGLPPHQVVAVGDSIEHDIAGASAAGIDSIFVVGGIHEKELKAPAGAAAGGAQPVGSALFYERLEGLGALHGGEGGGAVRPTYVMDRLVVGSV